MTDAGVQTAPGAEAGVPLSRREFLNYLWGASMAVFMAGAGGVSLWFALPRFRQGEFGGVFTLPIANLPTPDSPPSDFPEGRYWLVNIGGGTQHDTRQPADYPLEPGIKAIYKVCVHLGCLYKWVPTNDRFDVPVPRIQVPQVRGAHRRTRSPQPGRVRDPGDRTPAAT